MGMCYVYAMVPQRCFIGQKNKTYEIILLLVCIDMIFHTRIDWISVCGCLCRIERSRRTAMVVDGRVPLRWRYR